MTAYQNVTSGIFFPSDIPPTISPTESNKRLLIGVTLSVLGNLLISVAMNIQKHSHNQLAETKQSYLKSLTWWCGLFLMIMGEIGNFTAYGFAPASLVAPLGTTAVIVNAIIAKIFLKEEARLRDVLGIGLAVVGAFLLVNFSNKSDSMLTGDEILHNLKQYTFIIYLILEICLFVFIIYLHHRLNYIKVVTILLQVALLGSLTVISAKAVSSMLNLSFSGSNQLLHPILYIMLLVMVATAVGQVKVLNQAMAAFDTSVVMPTNFVFFTVSAILSGIVFYQEFYGLTFIEVFMFLFGACLSFGGVYLITGGRNTDSEKESGGSDDEENEQLIPNDKNGSGDVDSNIEDQSSNMSNMSNIQESDVENNNFTSSDDGRPFPKHGL